MEGIVVAPHFLGAKLLPALATYGPFLSRRTEEWERKTAKTSPARLSGDQCMTSVLSLAMTEAANTIEWTLSFIPWLCLAETPASFEVVANNNSTQH